MDFNKYKLGLARSLVAVTVFGLASCITTTSGPEPEKWAPEERAEAHVNLGMTYLRENQFDTAETEFKLALQTNPKSDAAYHSMGLLMARKGQANDATQFFAKAVELNPENFLAVNDYAIHVCQNGDAKRGLNALKRIENNAENDQQLGTRLGLGICNFEDENYEQANIYLRSVLQESPNIAAALYRMGEINYREENYLSARAFVERYFATGAMSERVLYLGALVEIEMGDTNKAGQYKRELETRYPGSTLSPKLDQALGE